MNSVASPDHLDNGQVGLLQVDPDTGVPVSESGDWLKSGEEKYLQFENEADARKYAESRLKDNPLLEWSMVDSDGKQLAMIHNQQALIEAAKLKKKAKPSFFSKWFKK